jgi:hypothetical protein
MDAGSHGGFKSKFAVVELSFFVLDAPWHDPLVGYFGRYSARLCEGWVVGCNMLGHVDS